MASLNRVVLVGNLTRDPEVRNTPDGIPVANLGIAINRNWTNKQGEREADFFTVIAWRKLAELCSQYLTKGAPVAIDGRLQSRSWETADGQKRSTVEVVADNIQFLNRGSASSGDFQNASAKKTTQETDSGLEPVGSKASDDAAELPDDDVPF